MFSFLGRSIKYAVKDFYRNFWLSLITVSVIFIALFSFNSLLLIKNVSDYTLQTIEKKINVGVFIQPNIAESTILDLRARILSLEEVKDVIYISADESLEAWKNKHSNDPVILRSLEEIGQNPLGAQLIVQAQSTNEYDSILNLLNDERYRQIIANKNFDEHTIIIEKVSGISEKIRNAAMLLTIIFTIVALIVVFNTIRIIIYTHRNEISIMRLVGATNSFIYLPYIWQTIIYSLIAVGLFLLAWYPLLGIIQPYVNELFTDGSALDIISYYNKNLFILFGGQVIILVVLLGLASVLAARKYTRI